jgi:hypothetical protein
MKSDTFYKKISDSLRKPIPPFEKFEEFNEVSKREFMKRDGVFGHFFGSDKLEKALSDSEWNPGEISFRTTLYRYLDNEGNNSKYFYEEMRILDERDSSKDHSESHWRIFYLDDNSVETNLLVEKSQPGWSGYRQPYLKWFNPDLYKILEGDTEELEKLAEGW